MLPVEHEAKKKKGSKGYPKGIIDHKKGKFQARLSYMVDNHTKTRPIPGTYKAPRVRAVRSPIQCRR